MSRANFVKLSAILALIFAAQCMSASVTYIVGKTGTSFSTISDALAATPRPPDRSGYLQDTRIIRNATGHLAEREGFEPSVQVLARTTV